MSSPIRPEPDDRWDPIPFEDDQSAPPPTGTGDPEAVQAFLQAKQRFYDRLADQNQPIIDEHTAATQTAAAVDQHAMEHYAKAVEYDQQERDARQQSDQQADQHRQQADQHRQQADQHRQQADQHRPAGRPARETSLPAALL